MTVTHEHRSRSRSIAAVQVWVPQHLKLEAPTCLQVLATSGLSHEHQTASFSLPPPSILLFFMLGLSSFNELISQITGSIPNYNRTQFRQPSELSAEITLFMGRGCVQRGHTTSQAQSCKLPKGLRCVPPTKSPANQGDGGGGGTGTHWQLRAATAWQPCSRLCLHCPSKAPGDS